MEGGVGRLSVRSVASAAGTTTNAVYTLFGDKSGLVRAVVIEALESFAASMEAAPVSDDVMEDLRAQGRLYREWALSRPVLYAVIFSRRPAEVPRDAPQSQLAFAPLLRGVERAIRDGRIIPGADPTTVALSFWFASHGMISLESRVLAHLSRAERDAIFEAHLMAFDHGWVVQS